MGSSVFYTQHVIHWIFILTDDGRFSERWELEYFPLDCFGGLVKKDGWLSRIWRELALQYFPGDCFVGGLVCWWGQMIIPQFWVHNFSKLMKHAVLLVIISGVEVNTEKYQLGMQLYQLKNCLFGLIIFSSFKNCSLAINISCGEHVGEHFLLQSTYSTFLSRCWYSIVCTCLWQCPQN